jgi:DivIVA domain-containing protein
MGQYVLLLVLAITVGAVVFGVTVLVSGSDPGLEVAEPAGRAIPLPATRPLIEADISGVRFDTAVRGYRMAQVDQALTRAAYDIGYKDELISVLEAEVTALREGRTSDADVLRRAREAALSAAAETAGTESADIELGVVGGTVAEPVDADEPEAPTADDDADEDSALAARDEDGGDERDADDATEDTDEPATDPKASTAKADPETAPVERP